MPCAEAVETEKLVDVLVQVVNAVQLSLTQVKEAPTPK